MSLSSLEDFCREQLPDLIRLEVSRLNVCPCSALAWLRERGEQAVWDWLAKYERG